MKAGVILYFELTSGLSFRVTTTLLLFFFLLAALDSSHFLSTANLRRFFIVHFTTKITHDPFTLTYLTQPT